MWRVGLFQAQEYAGQRGDGPVVDSEKGAGEGEDGARSMGSAQARRAVYAETLRFQRA